MAEKRIPRLPAWLRSLLPWILTAALLGLVYWKVNIDETLARFRGANLLLFLPVAIAFNFYVFFVNAYVYTKVLNWFCGPISYRTVLSIRGASYLLVSLNSGAGQGGLLLWLSKKGKLPLKQVVSAAMMLPVADLLFLTLALTIPAVLQFIFGGLLPAAHMHLLLIVLAVMWSILILFFAFWSRPARNVMSHFKEGPWVKAYREARPMHYIKLLGIRCCQHIPGILAFYAALIAFGGKVPLVTFVVRFFPALIIQSLPITVAQLGTSQQGWALMFGDIVDLNILVAFTLSWSFVYFVSRVLIGVFFFRGEARDFFKDMGKDSSEPMVKPTAWD